MRKKVWTVFLTWALCLVSFAAKGQGEMTHLVFSTQCPAHAQFAGYYAALANGFYAEEGLDVEIIHPSATQDAIEKILTHECDVTIFPLSFAMRTIADGIPLVNILQTSMNSSTMLISRWGHDPMTLKGAKVTTLRSGIGQVGRCMAEKENLQFEWVEAATCVSLFVCGAVDATLARSYNEYFQLLQTGLIDPEGEAVYRFSEHGYNIQQDGVYVTREEYEAAPEVFERFARASRRGWDWVVDHREETLNYVMEYVDMYRIATNRTLQGLMLDEVLRLQKDPDTGERAYKIRPEMVDLVNDLVYGQGRMARRVALEELLP